MAEEPTACERCGSEDLVAGYTEAICRRCMTCGVVVRFCPKRICTGLDELERRRIEEAMAAERSREERQRAADERAKKLADMKRAQEPAKLRDRAKLEARARGGVAARG